MNQKKIEPCSNPEACNAQGCINPAGRCEEAAAAPQVVADERKLPVATWFAIDHADGVQFHPSEEQALRYSESGQCVKYFSEDQMRAALQAAPVQAQEPVSDTQTQDVYALLAHVGASLFKELGYGDHQGDQKSKINDVMRSAMTDEMGKSLLADIFRAPVQPVAVPDGWNPEGCADSKERCRKMLLRHMKDLGLSDGNPGWIEHSDEGGKIVRDALSFEGELLFAFQVIGDALQAAPAAQGDGETDMFLRGVIAALGALAPHCQHGDVIHDEIVRSVGKEALYRTAEPEDVVWAALDPEFYAAIAAKAAS